MDERRLEHLRDVQQRIDELRSHMHELMRYRLASLMHPEWFHHDAAPAAHDWLSGEIEDCKRGLRELEQIKHLIQIFRDGQNSNVVRPVFSQWMMEL